MLNFLVNCNRHISQFSTLLNNTGSKRHVPLLELRNDAKPTKIPKIVGGRSVSIKKVPYQITITGRDEKRPFCGGSIISTTHILTAAHCLEYVKYFPFIFKNSE